MPDSSIQDESPARMADGQHSSSGASKSPFEFAAWLIDLDGTLYHQKCVRAMMVMELALSGWPAINTLRTFRKEHERLRKSAATGDPFALQICHTAEQLNLPDSDVATIVNDWMVERPSKWLRMFRRRSLLRIISRYRLQGGQTAIVSDYPARRKLAAMGASELFDKIVACGEHGGPDGLKPNPAGYLLAASRLGISPHECLVIGDRNDADGEAARRAGMTFRHIKDRWDI